MLGRIFRKQRVRVKAGREYLDFEGVTVENARSRGDGSWLGEAVSDDGQLKAVCSRAPRAKFWRARVG